MQLKKIAYTPLLVVPECVQVISLKIQRCEWHQMTTCVISHSYHMFTPKLHIHHFMCTIIQTIPQKKHIETPSVGYIKMDQSSTTTIRFNIHQNGSIIHNHNQIQYPSQVGVYQQFSTNSGSWPGWVAPHLRCPLQKSYPEDPETPDETCSRGLVLENIRWT